MHRDLVVRSRVPAAPLYDWPLEFWSPDGQYVVFCGQSKGEAAQLLLVARGQIQPLGPQNVTLKHAAWNRASSQLVLVSIVEYQTYRVHLFDVAEGRLTDLAQECQRVFGVSEPYLEPLWTADDRFLVGSNLELGGYLIQPTPFEVRLLGRNLQKPGRGDGLRVPPYIRGQAAPGILVAQLAPNDAAVDYHGKVLKDLGSGGLSGWTVLPDGKRAVSVAPENKIVVATIE